MPHREIILTLPLLILSVIGFGLPESNACGVQAKYFPEKDTVVTNGNPILFVNQSINAASIQWFVNGQPASAGGTLTFSPAIGVSEIKLIAANGNCLDTAYSYVIWDGVQPGQYSNLQKQFHPPGNAMEPFCITSDQSGGWLLAGNYYIPSANDFVTRSTCLFHINEKACVDWAKSMKPAEQEVIQAMIPTSDSGFLISAFPFQSQQDNYPTDLHLYKLDKQGNTVWAHSYSKNGTVINYYSALFETSDRGFVLELGSFPSAGSAASLSIIKIDTGGALIWGRSLSVEDKAFYNVGGILEKGNLIYASGSISQAAAPFGTLRSFLIQLDGTTGQVMRTWQNDPAKTSLSFTDIHLYKDGLVLNSYAQDLQNHFIFLDGNGNELSSLMISNPYGSLNGKENMVVSPDNGIYFHQSSGIAGAAHKDVILRLDSNLQMIWQNDYSTSALNFSGWNQLYSAPDNGIAGIGGGLLSAGVKALVYLRMDSLGNGCHSGQTTTQVTDFPVSLVALDWITNAPMVLDAKNLAPELSNMPMESSLLCPKYIDGCDLLKLEGPARICQPGDTVHYILHKDPFCADVVQWSYDESFVKIISIETSGLNLMATHAGQFVIKVQKNGCNSIVDSIIVSAGESIAKPALPGDTVLCAGTTMKLNAGIGYSQYLWQDGSTGPEIEITDSGLYWVRLTEAGGCAYVDTVLVDSIKTLPAYFLPSDTVICSGSVLKLKTNQIFESYTWSSGETTASLDIKNRGTYSLQVTDRYGCPGRDTIQVETKTCAKGLFFSNAFTPNEDGINDLFKPRMFIPPVHYRLIIYNRWGQKVFETKEPGAGWDGSLHNAAQESGTYIWFCTYQFEGEAEKKSSGTVVLLR
jgi:gliding motility-associated-like protein